MRRLLLIILLTCAIPLAACGSGGHYVGGVAAHGVANHLAPKHRRTINKVFCLYHGHRVLVDVRHHHYLTAGLNAYSAYRSCKGGFGRHH